MRRAASLLLLSTLAAAAWAQNSSQPSNVPEHEDFYRVYGYETPLQGWLEPNYWTTWVPRSSGTYDHFHRSLGREGLMAHSFELEYGVSDHFALATYLDFEDPHGTGPMFTQGHIEARYRFAQAYDHWINSAVYAEYYLPRKGYRDSQSIEFRGIFEKDLQDLRVDVNPLLDVSTTGSERGDAPQLGLDIGLYYRRFFTLEPALEYDSSFGAIDNFPAPGRQQQLLFPSMIVQFQRNWLWNAGVGFGLTHASDNVTLKSQLTYEFDAIRPDRLFRKSGLRYVRSTDE